MDEPQLDWTLTARSSAMLDGLNAISRRLPVSTWRVASLVRARELIARSLGLGRLRLHGAMPSGHVGTMMPGQMYFVDDSQAVLDGEDLGRPVRFAENPVIGDVPMPARGVFAIGGGAFRIRDQAEYAAAVANA
jgi:hypothetical protein